MNPSQSANRTPDLSPILVEVIGSALVSTVDEMGEALVRASHSTNIKERRDCSTAILDARGTMLCQAEHIPMHLGSFIGFIDAVLARNSLDDLRPGDVFIGNDAYEGGGTHLPDIILAEPIFYGTRPIAWAINTAHHSDFVDRAHANIYQEGLRIPPLRLYRAGVLQEDLRSLILTNCQVPQERISDLSAQMAANRLGVQRVVALCDKYGVDTMLAAGNELLDYAERKMRVGIAALPDGVYRFRDSFDSESFEGELELGVEIAVAGDEMILRFDSPDQLRASVNVVLTALLSTVYYAVKSVVDPTILPNAGLARPITVIARQGSLLNCRHPAAVDGRIAACQRVVDLVYGALAQVVSERVTAASNGACSSASFIGANPDGSYWVYVESIGGGMGARHNKDGLSGVHVHMTNTSNLPVEALEPEYPITLLRYELVDGSGGVGTWRGGMGLRRVYRVDADCHVQITGSRFGNRPWGLAGGGEGGAASIRVSDGHGVLVAGAGAVARGGIVEIITPGAGGYGPPQGRAAELVRADLREGRITRETALAAYGEHWLPTP